MKREYTQEDLLERVRKTDSMRELLLSYGLSGKGSNFSIMRARLERMGIDTAHWTGQGWRRNKTFKTTRKKLDEILCDNSIYSSGSPYASSKVKKILFRNDLKKKECERCGVSEWQGISLSLELHHMDGNSKNNQLDNLQILCPNCHSLTNNFRGKNIK